MTTTLRRRRAVLLVAGLTLSGVLAGCGPFGGGEQSAFCGQLEQAYPAFQADPTKALPPDAGASEWKASFDLNHQRIGTLIAAAPNEMSGPLTSLQTANDRLAAVYAEAEYDPKQIDGGLVTQLLSDSGYRSAHETVARYAKDTCHLDVGASASPAAS